MPRLEPDSMSERLRVSRRRLVGLAPAAMAAPLLPGAAALAQIEQGAATPEAGTPIASPAASTPVDTEKLMSVSTALVGSDALSEDGVGPLAQLIGADAALSRGFDELAGVDDLASDGGLDGLSDDAKATATDILTYWYLGQFEGQPVENRAELFFGLPVWQTVPYATQPTLCKSFGYWATDPGVES